MERLERPLGPPWASLGPSLGLLNLFFGPSWAMLGSLGGPLGPHHQFSFSFSTFLAGRWWASLGVGGHPLGPLGAISGLVGLFLGPSRGHLLPLSRWSISFFLSGCGSLYVALWLLTACGSLGALEGEFAATVRKPAVVNQWPDG